MEKFYMVDVRMEWDELEVTIPKGKLNSNFQNEDYEWFPDSIKVNVLPKSKREILCDFKENVQKNLQERSVKHSLGEQQLFFMKEATYQEFSNRFKEYEEEFYQIKEELLSEYENYKNEVFTNVASMLSEASDKEEFIQAMKRDVPSKKQFGESFKIKMDKMDATSTVMANAEIKMKFN
ncbi:hypothetical protein ACE38V_18150 [Cytobacillus sp. Hz8]|uniref:hypothetical protein n=1 Tax=Cytobacillus sp. Hz8 TaxID=3347168 RepID=UPI0035E2122B